MQSAWRCAACELAGSDDAAKPMHEYGVWDMDDFRSKLLPQGAWTRCSRCSIRKKSANANAVASEARTAQRQANFQAYFQVYKSFFSLMNSTKHYQ